MRLLTRAIFMMCFLACSAWAAEKADLRQQYNDKYRALTDTNIFLRDRTKPSTTRSSSNGSRPPARPVEESFVLRGVAIEEDGYRAYLEDTRSASIVRVDNGEEIARGKVSAIDIDAIEYEQNGTKTWVAVGHDLTGKASTLVAEASDESSSDSAAPTTGPTAEGTSASGGAPAAGSGSASKVNINDPNLSIEQRLKLRRQQELKK